METLQRRHNHAQNLHEAERIASIIAGAALGYYGIRQSLTHHPLPGASYTLAGAALIKRGVTGYCDLYRAFGVQTANKGHAGENESISYQQGIRIDRSVTVNVSPEAVYSFWRNLENLPRFMKHVQSIKRIDGEKSHWTVEGPAGKKIEWDAEIINDIPNELIAWRSLPGAQVDNAGSVRFEQAAAGRGTTITVKLQYNPPAGHVGAAIARLFGKNPEQEVEAELRRLKNILEAGEVPTAEGQPSGRTQDRKEEKARSDQNQENVHAASEDSFPASDAPAYTH